MNRLITRPWFGPAVGTVCYVAGFNDELLHVIGEAWLDLSRGVQTIVVVAILALIAYFVVDRLRQRQSYFEAAVRAAAPGDPEAGSFGASGPNPSQLTRELS